MNTVQTDTVKFCKPEKNDILLRRLVHSFCQKNRPFSHVLQKKRKKTHFFNILDREECLFHLKSEVL